MPIEPALDTEQSQGLLAGAQTNDPDSASRSRPRLHPNARRQSSFSKRPQNGGPRTPNRVRFELEEQEEEEAGGPHRALHIEGNGTLDDLDYLSDDVGPRASTGQRAPLLIGIEAPSITVANALEFNPEDHLESARPKSGIRSAFVNMANSIIGAGIIGQPYAFKQAGLITGIVLLVVLTITVDWTINLIVINSKMSGANSFQTTMQHCFGRTGLIAISVAQWAFAFGGMIAFCIIVGDTIPRVLGAFFPSLHEVPFLWLLTNRRAVIILFILGLSYPLSLYRDIAKVDSSSAIEETQADLTQLAKASGLALISMCIIIVTIISQGARVSSEHKGALKSHIVIGDGVAQAIGVISFGEMPLYRT